MKEKLEQIRREALEALEQTKAAQDLEALRVKYLGKKGLLIKSKRKKQQLSLAKIVQLSQLIFI